MSHPLILEARDAFVATLTFNLPDRLNAMTQAMGECFAERVTELSTDPDLRALVITGQGRAFSAGGDLSMIGGRADEGTERPGAARRRIRDSMLGFYKLFLSVRELPFPTVAAINGHAIGAGCCVALACDLRVVAKEAKLGLNFTRLGLSPGMAATWNLPRLVGPALAAELLYTGRLFSGAEAARIGLANRSVPRESVLSAALDLASEVAGSAPLAVRAVKRALERSAGVSLEDQLSFEATEQAACFETEDVREGLAAVAAKRAPVFRGR